MKNVYGLEKSRRCHGKVKVQDIEVGGVKYDDSEYGPGDYFGERAIVTSEPRAATITAVEETNAFALSRDVFIKVLCSIRIRTS